MSDTKIDVSGECALTAKDHYERVRRAAKAITGFSGIRKRRYARYRVQGLSKTESSLRACAEVTRLDDEPLEGKSVKQQKASASQRAHKWEKDPAVIAYMDALLAQQEAVADVNRFTVAQNLADILMSGDSETARS